MNSNPTKKTKNTRNCYTNTRVELQGHSTIKKELFAQLPVNMGIMHPGKKRRGPI